MCRIEPTTVLGFFIKVQLLAKVVSPAGQLCLQDVSDIGNCLSWTMAPLLCLPHALLILSHLWVLACRDFPCGVLPLAPQWISVPRTDLSWIPEKWVTIFSISPMFVSSF